jgi:subtilisin family serine protease
MEVLEDRLLPSLAPPPTLAQWRHERYTIDKMKVVSAPAQVSALAGATTLQGGQLIGVDQVDANYPYRGAGYAVAVIDTGIDYTNPAFGNRVIAGWNFVNNTANYMDDNGHGTGVAGVIAGANGIAPDANLIALKVLSASGAGSFGAIQSALDWVVAHEQQYNIVAVNMSLGAGNYLSNPYTFLDSDLQKLTGEGVFIAVASGNDFYPDRSQQGLAFPAVDPNVVSVGAVWDGNFGEVRWADGAIDYSTAADQLTSFTQRDSSLDILAPGAMVTSLWLKNGTQSLAGTSIATPFITGAAVILHEEFDALGEHSLANQNSILSVMQSTGKAIVDAGANTNVKPTGLTFKRLDLYAAVQSIGGRSSTPTLDPIANQTVGQNQAITLTLFGHDADGDTLTYTAQVQGAQSSGATAYQLKQQLGLTYAGSYYTNSWGQNEKWLQGTGGLWYIVLPDGELRKWSSTLSATLAPAALIATLNASYYNDPSLLWNAQPAGAPAISVSISGNRLVIQPPSGYTGSFTVQVTVSDGQASTSQSFQVTVTANTSPPVLDPIANQTVNQGQSVQVTLSGHDADGSQLVYSAQVLGGSSNATVSLNGDQLTVQPGPGYTGTFTVQVTVSDGPATAVQAFTVTVVGTTAPTLGTIAGQKMKSGGTLTVSVPVQSSAGSALTFTATVQNEISTTYQLRTRYSLGYAGSYYTSVWGLHEKWLVGAHSQWFFILPDGELRRWQGSVAATLGSAGLVANLGRACYANPGLLWHAQQAPPITIRVSGSTLTIHAPTGFVGSFAVSVTATDGSTTATQLFTVTVNP